MRVNAFFPKRNPLTVVTESIQFLSHSRFATEQILTIDGFYSVELAYVTRDRWSTRSTCNTEYRFLILLFTRQSNVAQLVGLLKTCAIRQPTSVVWFWATFSYIICTNSKYVLHMYTNVTYILIWVQRKIDCSLISTSFNFNIVYFICHLISMFVINLKSVHLFL